MNREQKLKNLKSNKGFTLVELIVVIVIVSILVGVTILGATQWVAKSRKNTDEHNASSLEKIFTTVLTLDVSISTHPEWFKRSGQYPDINDGNPVFIYHWKDGGQLKRTNGGIFFYDLENNQQRGCDWGHMNFDGYPDAASWAILGAIADFDKDLILPKNQQNERFAMIIYFDDQGRLRKVVCTPYAVCHGGNILPGDTAKKYQ